ncbi:MAG TPA: HAMP domain-containing histidine kinase [Phycisphaerales bacterium]|nr:HAMP domain-containing histidine kinase [Phycisphaerales bacterium]HIB51500.1 HAMP domain-containing histidine kinase [Phycisphaerales bacterium]HIN83752.1 HAMP domain-containing histidine kinase [Phycisphaerales bacterium]HIO19649.1 HAMP domain-containing histidine kinase [Phycisphaerales bacterium]HIO52572.1 HAMP domain-containing histidine kinase [Phycisphaerales bacterium]
MGSRVSLANKCLAIFGTANVIIITSLLGVLWMSSSSVLQDYQLEVARQLAYVWINSEVKAEVFDDDDVNIHLVRISEIDRSDNTFVERALEAFEKDEGSLSEFYDHYDRDQHNYFQFAKPITISQMGSLRKEGFTDYGSGVNAPSVSDPLEAILVIRRKSTFAKTQLNDTRTLIIVAGIVGSLISVLVYYFIFKRLIFSPVRKLRRVTERVQKGDLTARSSLATGDEFEELSIAFNEMLDRMEKDQHRLQKMNESLDLKVEELAEVNVGLFESGRLKNAFIANVSHELRTPLNSIIGFAELLEGMSIETEKDQEKRIRYLRNILTSGRSLLDMINELLDMAKIESGRMEVNLESTSISDLLEGLVSIMRPQSKTKGLELELQLQNDLPPVQTDAGKLQQILYNYLSNAIKFSPLDSKVIITASTISSYGDSSAIRIMVKDDGPGIPEDMLEMVFEKFRQVDATHTKEHSGTGLGLAICRELSELLHAKLGVTSMHGKGSSFYVDIPEVFASEAPEALMSE